MKDSRERWLDADAEKVSCLVSEVFGGSGKGRDDRVEGVGYAECPLSREDIEAAVRQVLRKTKNWSAPGPDKDQLPTY